MIKQIGLPLRGRLILLISCMITDRIGPHSVLLPLLLAVLLPLLIVLMLYHVVTNYVVHKLIPRSGHPEHLQELLLTSIFSIKWKNNFKVLTRTSKNLSV